MKANAMGDMSPKVKDYQPSDSQFSGKQAGKTNDCVERTNKTQQAQSSKLKSMAYKGRYE